MTKPAQQFTQVGVKSVLVKDVEQIRIKAKLLGYSEQEFYRRLFHWAAEQDSIHLMQYFLDQMDKEKAK